MSKKVKTAAIVQVAAAPVQPQRTAVIRPLPSTTRFRRSALNSSVTTWRGCRLAAPEARRRIQ
jgi:hypothetical protein